MLTVILKGTNGCNLDCAYCSLGKKPNHDVVSEDRMIEILDYIVRVCRHRNEHEFHMILHGGEPTLVPVPLYRKAFAWLNETHTDIRAHILIQTNAYHITGELMEFLREYGVRVGVSFDGSKKIHDAERKNRNAEATFETVKGNIERLSENGIPVSCLMVLTSNGLKENYEYIRYFAEKKIHLKINPLLDYGEVYENPELSLKSGEYAEYLIGLYEYIVEHEIDVSVSPLTELVQSSMEGKSLTECTYNPECSRNFLCIDYRGDIYPCGRFSDISSFCLGNVCSAPAEFEESGKIKRLLNRKNGAKPEPCRTCRYVLKCNCGCSAEAVIEGGILRAPKLCEDYKALFSYFECDGLLFMREHLKKRKEEMLVV